MYVIFYDDQVASELNDIVDWVIQFCLIDLHSFLCNIIIDWEACWDEKLVNVLKPAIDVWELGLVKNIQMVKIMRFERWTQQPCYSLA